ncbi:MAG: AMP-binding protein [Kiritimatiellia bacterium]
MTLRNLLENAVDKLPERIAIRYKQAGEWKSISYAVLYDNVARMAEAFADLGIRPVDNNVALMLDNCPEWIESYFALAGCGVPVVPVDPRLQPDEIAYILKDSQSVMLIAHERHIPVISDMYEDLPDLHSAVIAGGTGDVGADDISLPLHSYNRLKSELAGRSGLSWFADHKPESGHVASIIYTSGTMGNPKGAMLTHNNFCSDVSGSLAAVDNVLNEKDDFLVVLPLFHSFSFTANLLIAVANASGLCFVENLRTLAQDIKELKPTILMGVPLLYEKLFYKILSRLQAHALPRFMLKTGMGRLLGFQVRKGLGGRLRYMIVGGAPCPVDVIRGFKLLGIPLVEGYGLTECSPVVCFPRLTEPHIGTIGRKLPNAEVRIAEPDETGSGELQVRGPMIMKGYYRNIEATRDAFDGEWLKTGDMARIDANGYISICGRRKALIVNREGKNIYPEEVENVIGVDPLLSDLVVVGYRVGSDPGERIGVIVAPDEDLLKQELDEDAADTARVEDFVRKRLMKQCEKLAAYKRPRKIVVRREPLERTSVQKVRRCLYQGWLDDEKE